MARRFLLDELLKMRNTGSSADMVEIYPDFNLHNSNEEHFSYAASRSASRSAQL
jgi:hypothetical protein